MCNHYANDLRKLGRFLGDLIGEQFSETRIKLRFGNLPVQVYPDKLAMVIHRTEEAFAWESMRWGYEPATPRGPLMTNLRHPGKPYWRKQLAVSQRCVIPATSFFEYDERTRGQGRMKEVEFARADGQPFYFAGFWRTWTGTRGTKKEPAEGEHQVFTFLTTDANALIAPYHPKAMPVILSNDDADAWMTAPLETAFELFQRPADEDALVAVEGA